jgi:hypothetical protein
MSPANYSDVNFTSEEKLLRGQDNSFRTLYLSKIDREADVHVH